MKVAVVGSGLASISALKVLIEKGIKPIVFDVGDGLDEGTQKIISRMSKLSPDEWNNEDREMISRNPTVNYPYKFPKKLSFGSDYFYGKNFDQLPFNSDKYPPPFSYAKGGLSVGWGASVLPPDDADLYDWPIKNEELRFHYKKVLDDLPFSAKKDDLNKTFPIYKENYSPLKLSRGNNIILQDLNNSNLKYSKDVLFGQSRLLVRKDDSRNDIGCKNCGLCMSGCVYGAIYKSSQDIDKMIEKGLIHYLKNTIVLKVDEKESKVSITYLDKIRQKKKIIVDKLFIGAGAVGTTRLVLESKNFYNMNVKMLSTVALILPMFRYKKLPFEWPNSFTLPSIFLEFKVDGLSDNWIHSQISTPNELVYKKLGIKLGKTDIVTRMKINLSRHLVFALANLNSKFSNGYLLNLTKTTDTKENKLISKREINNITFDAIKKTVSRFKKISKDFGYITITPLVKNTVNTGSSHLGGIFPMKKAPKEKIETDLLGRLLGWDHIHIIDSSVFPSLPGTTIGLLSMANARRIVSEVKF